MDVQDHRIQAAIEEAKQAQAFAYAPYSQFKMGAAIVTDEGHIVRGVLVENVSLGLAMCSERVAFFNAVTQQAGRPVALILAAPRTDGHLTWPCGACLQVARELGSSQLLIVATDSTEVRSAILDDLAPRLPAKATS